MLGALNDSDAEVRHDAVEALGNYRVTGAVPGLVLAVAEPPHR